MPPADETPRIAPDVPTEQPNGKAAPDADKPKQRGPGLRKLETQLTELYETVAVMVVSPFDRLGGALMHRQASDLAASWIDLAERDARVKATLERILEATGWGAVVMTHAMIVIPVLANRGYLPDTVAQGAAGMTILQNPDLAPLFTHERWSPNPSTNGNSGGE